MEVANLTDMYPVNAFTDSSLKTASGVTFSRNDSKLKSSYDLASDIIELEAQMKKYSEDLDFERAIECRDRIKRLEKEIQIKNDRK